MLLRLKRPAVFFSAAGLLLVLLRRFSPALYRDGSGRELVDRRRLVPAVGFFGVPEVLASADDLLNTLRGIINPDCIVEYNVEDGPVSALWRERVGRGGE